jgi:hypothetical protein
MGVITNVFIKCLTKPKLPPNAVFHAQNLVVLNTCSNLRKFLNFEDYLPKE